MEIIAWDLTTNTVISPERLPTVGEHARFVEGERVWFGEYHPLPTFTDQEIAEEQARTWRDEELDATDKSANTLDWPNRTNILAYRVLLRDWPSTEDFPATRPILEG